MFSDLLSLEILAYTRLVIALSCWYVTYFMFFQAKPLEIVSTYRPNSKLKASKFYLKGFSMLCPFTSWCWIMLTGSYSLNAYISLAVHFGREDEIPGWILKSAFILWEVAAPFALLVSAVVRYAIWPAVLAQKRPHQLGDFLFQMQHNMNSIYILVELCLLGGIPIKFSHMSLPMLVGGIYILFTWFITWSLTDRKLGPQYLYWFLDTTLGSGTTIALAVLVSVLVMAFVTFAAVDSFVEWTGPNLISHVLTVLVVASAVVKTR